MKTNLNLIRKTTLVALCAVALSPAAMFAANTPRSSEERGLIKLVDNNAQQIVVADRKTKADGTFKWNHQTKFIGHGKAVSASALKEGERVHLTYTPGGDTPILKSVQIAPAKTEKHSANNLSRARTNCA
jgi:hypothetical protein